MFQGEELGMTNVKFQMEDYRDIETLNMYQERKEEGYTEEEIMTSLYAKSRDNARTPMQWDDSVHGGFTTGTPWIKVNPNYTEINAASQVGRPDSIFTYYKTLIHMRKEYGVFVDGKFELLVPEHPQVFAYTRTNEDSQLLVVCNFYGDKIECPVEIDTEKYEMLLTNETENTDVNVLMPYEARMYIRK